MFRPFSRKQKPSSLLPGGPAAQPTFYRMHQTRQPHQGALSYAFDPRWLNPVQNVFGNSILAKGLQSLPGQATISQQTTLTAGLGGIVAGQYMLQPLIDPSNNE